MAKHAPDLRLHARCASDAEGCFSSAPARQSHNPEEIHHAPWHLTVRQRENTIEVGEGPRVAGLDVRVVTRNRAPRKKRREGPIGPEKCATAVSMVVGRGTSASLPNGRDTVPEQHTDGMRMAGHIISQFLVE